MYIVCSKLFILDELIAEIVTQTNLHANNLKKFFFFSWLEIRNNDRKFVLIPIVKS